MTETQFNERLEQIQRGHAERRESADAYRDQELSRLFDESGWTQERIARHMAKSESWVQKRLIFGRFLKLRTTGTEGITRLTERAFRRHWAKTKGKEEERFRQIAEALAGCDLPLAYKNILVKPGYTQAVRDVLADGKWHKAEAILASLEERFPELTKEKLHNVLGELKRPHLRQRVESDRRKGVWQYRLGPVTADPVRAAVETLYEQCKPHLEALRELSRYRQAALPPGEIAKLVVRLQRVFDAACSQDTVSS